ncbi:hypothetical protein [Bacillus suaedaesalsae]|uniref:Uncharacterized protein n=1 Tax=Bacillus suaedaesalsae TaxID=2810349 RepID=A0ABS2DEY5_9BACI|nr:hypothetical protein [Bacillus suaedaesalsae]MBM6617027.1 hypothetical protein [Bacillus suaedaesalsae]
MLVGILVTGLILGIMVRVFLKFVIGGYGFANDIENQPVILKACRYCNNKVPKGYTKNTCPTCYKQLE